MRRIMNIGYFVALTVACTAVPRPVPDGARDASPGGGIPITTRSEAARARFLSGRALNENLQVHEANALFREAVALDPTFALGEYSIAATAPTAKESAEHLEKAVALSAQASPGERLLILGLQARKHGDPARARRLADSLVLLHPTDERAHWTLANACSAQQHYDCAITELLTAIRINPRYSLAYNQLGYAYRSAGRMSDAEQAFQQYIALVPNDPNPYDSYAELLMKAGRFDESIAQYRKALSLDPHFTGAFSGIAGNEMLAGRYEAAIAISEHYFALARDDYERRTALLDMAMTYVDQGATKNAVGAMERRLAKARFIDDTVNMAADGVMIGDILLEAGDPLAARARYGAAHELVAKSGVAAALKQDDVLARHYDDARVALALGDLPTARREARAYALGASARQNDARIRQAHALYGLVALAAHQGDEALLEFSRADQQSPSVIAGMSRAHALKGDAERAKQLAKEAREMNILPSFDYVFTRASLARATRSATSAGAAGMPH